MNLIVHWMTLNTTIRCKHALQGWTDRNSVIKELVNWAKINTTPSDWCVYDAKNVSYVWPTSLEKIYFRLTKRCSHEPIARNNNNNKMPVAIQFSSWRKIKWWREMFRFIFLLIDRVRCVKTCSFNDSHRQTCILSMN